MNGPFSQGSTGPCDGRSECFEGKAVMIRYTLFAMAIIGTAATAIAAVAPEQTALQQDQNVTVIEKNDVFPILGPITVEECAVEDCSDVQS
jgi:hypothetical protein